MQRKRTSRSKTNGVQRADSLTRFMAKVEFTADGCWEWTAAADLKGYGRFVPHRKVWCAHRWSYDQWNGPVPEGHSVLHRCDNPPCVNPGHLFTGTHADNSADMRAKGRSCTGSRNPRATISWTIAREARRMYAAGGITNREIAERFGVRKAVIQAVTSGRTFVE